MMRILCLLAVVTGSITGQGPSAPWRPEPPRLVVLLVVDQLSESVLANAWPHLLPPENGGFRRLSAEGVRFGRCFYRHGCTYTGPGHATLSTGAPASLHGIVGNGWRDPDTGRKVYCVDDPGTDIVGLLDPEKGLGKGNGPQHLRTITLGDAMKASFGPDVAVVSLSWKDRSAILMGGASADQVLWVERGEGRLVTSTHYATEIPAWAARFQVEHPTKEWFAREWTRIGPDSAYAGLEDDRRAESPDPRGHRTLPRVVDGGLDRDSLVLAGSKFYDQMYGSPFANEHLLLLAEAALRDVPLGRDGTPDLLCVSFSANDVVGHASGPDSVEARDMTLRTDRLVAQLLESLDARVGLDRCLILASADHGIGPIPEVLGARRIPAGRAPLINGLAIAAEGALRKALGPPPPSEARGETEPGSKKTARWVLAEGENGIYLDRLRLTASGIDLLRARRIAAAGAAELPGIAFSHALDDLLAGKVPRDAVHDAMCQAVHPAVSADVIVIARPYWIGPGATATHGGPYPYDRHVPLLVRGPGVLALGVDRLDLTPVTPGHAALLATHLLGIPDLPGAPSPLPTSILR